MTGVACDLPKLKLSSGEVYAGFVGCAAEYWRRQGARELAQSRAADP